MKLLKIILIIFAIYFIRKFIQMYRAMKRLEEERIHHHEATNQGSGPSEKKSGAVEAEYKVLDN